MWNKNEPAPPAPQKNEPQPPSPGPGRVATIGPSITIKGDLSGGEDLVIEGSVEGEVFLHQQHVTVGPSGRVRADIHGKHICVEGEVRGNLEGEEVVVIRKSGKVEGNVTAPRVTLENGANFRGSIDMQPGGKGKAGKGASPGKASARPGDRPASRPRDPSPLAAPGG